jgi:hypothetical protein
LVVSGSNGSSGIVVHELPDAAGVSNTAYSAVTVAPDGSIFAAGESHGWSLISKYRLA